MLTGGFAANQWICMGNNMGLAFRGVDNIKVKLSLVIERFQL